MVPEHPKAKRLVHARLRRASMLALLVTCLLALALALGLHPTLTEATDDVVPVSELRIAVDAPLCGQTPTEAPPSATLSPNNQVLQISSATWVSSPDANGIDAPLSLEDIFVGEEEYTCLLTLSTATGYVFDRKTAVLVYDESEHEYLPADALQRDKTSMTVAVTVTARHDWDEGRSWRRNATCKDEGLEHRECRADPSHVEETIFEASPDAHKWGDWETTKEPTKTEEGEKRRICSLCGEVETQSLPKILYASVYEPDTSWPMAATVAWRAGQDAMEVAAAKVRPATTFVWLDKNLGVHDRDGKLIARDLESYADATAQTMIPALYINDAATATALKEWLEQGKLLDCFVVSTPDNQKLVANVADLVHVRGMLDYTSVTSPSRRDLVDMVASTNAAHGKVILLSAEAATYKNVRFLQKLGSTIWAQTPTDTNTLLTLYTNGVNGVVVDDFEKAFDAEGFFDDDAPSLLRVPFIISHRGDPSTYVENTLDSALGAYAEGADGIENDIHLSADGELFIYHDDYPTGIMGASDVDENGDLIPLEAMTLSQVRSHVFPWESILQSNQVSQNWWRFDTLYGQEEQKRYVVPTLREYIETFRGTPLVHVTEFKSKNPEILPRYKTLVDEYNAWDQFISITFVKDILVAAYQNYPELSIGALATEDNGDSTLGTIDYDRLAKQKGTEAALQQLMGQLDQWNATYNPVKNSYGTDVARAARHRGLTIWPWTYSLGSAEELAHDYLAAVTGVTGNHSWTTSNLIVYIAAKDVTVDSLSAVPKPQATTQAGKYLWLDEAEFVQVEQLSEHQMRAIWRYKADLILDGASHGSYYLYSNPFVVTTSAEGQESHTHDWDSWVVTESATSTTEGHESRQCKTCGEVQERTIPLLDQHDESTSGPTAPEAPTTETVIEQPMGDKAQSLLPVKHDDSASTAVAEVPSEPSAVQAVTGSPMPISPAYLAAAVTFLLFVLAVRRALRKRPSGRHTASRRRRKRANGRRAKDTAQRRGSGKHSSRGSGQRRPADERGRRRPPQRGPESHRPRS